MDQRACPINDRLKRVAGGGLRHDLFETVPFAKVETCNRLEGFTLGLLGVVLAHGPQAVPLPQ